MARHIVPQFYGTVKDGRLSLDRREMFEEYLKHISGPVLLVLKRPRKPRSVNENNYYWGVVIQMISDETGMTPEETHEAMKWQFLRKQVGQIFTVKSTRILNTLEFEDFVERVRVFAQTNLNIKIPLPNETE